MRQILARRLALVRLALVRLAPALEVPLRALLVVHHLHLKDLHLDLHLDLLLLLLRLRMEMNALMLLCALVTAQLIIVDGPGKKEPMRKLQHANVLHKLDQSQMSHSLENMTGKVPVSIKISVMLIGIHALLDNAHGHGNLVCKNLLNYVVAIGSITSGALYVQIHLYAPTLVAKVNADGLTFQRLNLKKIHDAVVIHMLLLPCLLCLNLTNTYGEMIAVIKNFVSNVRTDSVSGLGLKVNRSRLSNAVVIGLNIFGVTSALIRLTVKHINHTMVLLAHPKNADGLGYQNKTWICMLKPAATLTIFQNLLSLSLNIPGVMLVIVKSYAMTQTMHALTANACGLIFQMNRKLLCTVAATELLNQVLMTMNGVLLAEMKLCVKILVIQECANGLGYQMNIVKMLSAAVIPENLSLQHLALGTIWLT